MHHGFSFLDWAIILLYFVVVYIIAFWSADRRQNPLANSANYFLAGRNVGWFVMGASLFAANIGSEHLVGLAGSGSVNGIVVAHFELFASLILLLFAWLFVPFYLKSAVYTMPEFLERRYSPAARWYLAIVSILGYILTKISVTIAAGAMVIQALTGIDFWLAAVVIVVATGIYTILGGFRAVLQTNTFQMFVFLVASIIITLIGIDKLGGWTEMRHIAGLEFFNLWKPLSDPNYPWIGIIFGAPILAVWYWCTDQYIVQKTLSAANIDQARGAAIFTGYLKLLPLFLFVLPGVIVYCLVQKGVIHITSSDQAFSTLVQYLLPSGLRGLVIAGLLAALMSSLSSVFNSCSALITWDIYRKYYPQASDHRLVVVGQIATVVVVLLGLLWIPFIKLVAGEIYEYLQSVQAYISPPIAAVFLIGLLWPRMNAKGAITALVVGFILGMLRLGCELYKTHLVPGGVWYYFATINFLYFAILLFLLCSVLLIGVSLITMAPDRERLTDMTVPSTLGSLNPNTPRRSLHIWLSILLFLLVMAIWFYFSKYGS